jgi:hypothetical protein
MKRGRSLRLLDLQLRGRPRSNKKPNAADQARTQTQELHGEHMAENDEQDLRDIQIEESSRGRKQPKTAVSLERERKIRRIAEMLDNPNCTKETYMKTIRAFGLSDQSAEFRQLLVLWQKRRGS